MVPFLSRHQAKPLPKDTIRRQILCGSHGGDERVLPSTDSGTVSPCPRAACFVATGRDEVATRQTWRLRHGFGFLATAVECTTLRHAPRCWKGAANEGQLTVCFCAGK